MKFSTRDRYALRLMVELANRPNDLIPLKDISDKQRISLKYLEQIVTPLAKSGLVSSVRGAQGGYRLARPATEITSGEILRAVEGELTAIQCQASAEDCHHSGQSHTQDFWSGLNDLINKYVDGITLEQLRTMPEVPEIGESCEYGLARAAEPPEKGSPSGELAELARPEGFGRLTIATASPL